MKIDRFEDIIAWQKAKELTLGLYTVFKDNRDYGFRDQIQRAAVSIMNNIAEGFERKGNREYSRFLFISKGSAGEVRSMLYLSKELGYIDDAQFNEMFGVSEEISKMIAGLIRKIDRS